MRLFIIAVYIISILLLAGCASNLSDNEFDVVFSDVSHYETYDSAIGKDIDGFSLRLSNNEMFDLNCSISISAKNTTNVSLNTENLGVVPAGKSRTGMITILMPAGSSDINLFHNCSKII